ncbi:LysR family transcriptional regulator, partial [Streptomyces sp. SID11233]|nr:LysR family transcriptional regulator [Streptomyces sp. SID11233]
PVGIAEFARESWIAGCPRCRTQLVEVCAAAGFAPRIDFATDDYPAVHALVAAGLGVAVLPALALESVRP